MERFFEPTENKTTFQQEIWGGLTTFMTLAYIIFVQPVVMHAAGMDLESALLATCISSALATFVIASLTMVMGQGIAFMHSIQRSSLRVMV